MSFFKNLRAFVGVTTNMATNIHGKQQKLRPTSPAAVGRHAIVVEAAPLLARSRALQPPLLLLVNHLMVCRWFVFGLALGARLGIVIDCIRIVLVLLRTRMKA